MSPRAHAWRQRAEQRRWTECDIEQCGRLVHGLSRYCTRHAAHAQHHGDAIAPVIHRLKHVKPYEVVARRLIHVNRTHPAVTLVRGQLDEMLATASRLGHGKAPPKRGDVDGRVRREFARLHAAGVTGRSILVIAMGLHAYARANVGAVGRQWIGSRRHRFALARLVLHSVMRSPPPLSSRVRDKAGEQLIRITETLLTAMEPAFARQSATHQGSAIHHPQDTPTGAPNTRDHQDHV